jgi:hypothetical protein
MKRLAVLLLVLMWGEAAVFASVLDVPSSYLSIQEAITAASSGDTILVDPGEYHEHLNFSGKNIVLASQFLTGEDTSFITSTIINGDSSGTVVTFESGEGRGALLTGFTITNGFASEGGGIACRNASGPTIKHNRIMANFAALKGAGILCAGGSDAFISENEINANYNMAGSYGEGGGGIACWESSPTVDNNYIHGNFAGSGAGVFLRHSFATVTHNHIAENAITLGYNIDLGAGIDNMEGSEAIIKFNLIENNIATQWAFGGGLAFSMAGGLIEENIIRGNRADMGGGIKAVEYSYPIILNNQILDNYASGGGGLDLEFSNPIVMKNKIAGNTAMSEGGGIYITNFCGGIVSNNLIVGNTAQLIEGGGISFIGPDTTWIINNTIVGNTSISASGLFYTATTSYYLPVISNNIIWGNSGQNVGNWGVSVIDPTYNDIQGGWVGEGNVDIDPMFRDTSSGDYHLTSYGCSDPGNSPLIDIGNPLISDDLLDCNHGMGTYLSDMGAYGGGFNYIPGDANSDHSTNGIDVIFMVNYLKGGSNHPRIYWCPNAGSFSASADANGNCVFNGLDVGYLVNFLKGIGQAPESCPDCPAGGPNRR